MNHPRLETHAVRASRARALPLVLLLLAGCGSDDTSSSAGGDGGSTTAAPTTVVYEVDVVDRLSEGPVTGAEICVVDGDPADCETTDADGLFSLELPADSEVAVRVAADGFQSALFLIQTTDQDRTGHWILAKVADVEAFLSTEDTLDWDRAKGAIGIFVNLDGVEASLDPASGDMFYQLGSGQLVFDDGTGTPEAAFVLFINVEPGEYELTLDNEGGSCMFRGWTTDREGVQRVVVRADHLTSLSDANCLR